MPLSDFWEIKDNQVLDGQPLLNIYQAKRILAGANATLVGQALIDQVITPMALAIQPIGVTRTTMEITNLGTVTDFTTLDTSGIPSGVAGNRLPEFNAAGIQFNRTRSDMKNGQKRWLAGAEPEQADGIWVPAFITLLQTAASNLLDPWETNAAPGVDVCEFVIIKRFCVVPGQDPCVAYELPTTDPLIDANHYVPVTATVRTRVRSQVSRKKLV